jgi:hypothetical protein
MKKSKLTRNLLLLFSILIVGGPLSAQNYKDHNWFKAVNHTEIPDSLKGEDAVMIYNNQYLYNDVVDLNNGNFLSKRTVMRKIKILTQKGLEEYSKVFVNIYPNERIKVIDARTIKADTKTIDLKSKDIKKLNFKSRFSEDSRAQQLRFSIPGVEVGDEVEIIYTVASNVLKRGDDISMHSYLPCLNASITYGSSKAFVHEFKMYNGMPSFEDQSSQNATTLVWRMSNLKSIGDQYRAVLTREIPFVRYVIRSFNSHTNSVDLSLNSWGAIYKKYADHFNDPVDIMSSSKYMKKFVANFRHQNLGLSNEQLFIKIQQYVNDSIEVKHLENGFDKRRLKYYLQNKRINPYNLYVLYDDLFRLLKIKRYICFGKNKYNGFLDRNFVAPHSIQYEFFSFYEGTRIHFVYPSKTYQKYLLDELPVSIGGSNVIMVDGDPKHQNDFEMKEIKIPMDAPEKNYLFKKLNLTIENPADTIFKSVSTTTFSGVFSTMYREDHFKALKKKETEFYAPFICEKELTIDTVKLIDKKLNRPFAYTLGSEQNFPIQMAKIDDGLYHLKLAQLLSVYSVYSSEADRFLNYYTRYLYNDITRINLQFKNNIKLENIENLRKLNIDNQFGSVMLNIVQKDEKNILINVSYRVKQELVKPNEYENLKELNVGLAEILLQNLTITFSD